ncbi:MAG: phosphatase PAP2 family protein [Prevotellaceae bacterium]|nr:phosphatase PAP2 family protein [Prevotellaceae bacterium]
MFYDLLKWIVQTDDRILLFINGMHTPYFDTFMQCYSGKWIWIPMYLSIYFVVLRNFHWKTMLLCMIGLGLTITFADQVGATLIRPLVERLRPSNLDNPISGFVHIVDGYRGGRFGFPSCHAANTFGLSFFIHYFFRRSWLSLFLFSWAVLTCYSRMYLGVHYLGDLLVGTFIGWIGAWLMYRLFLYLSRFQGSFTHPDTLHYNLFPVCIGLSTIAGIAVYAAFA